MLAFFSREEFDPEVAASALLASLESDASPASGAVPAIWERKDFLSAAAANNGLLTQLLDDWLADAIPAAPALASALDALFSSLESEVDALCAARLASFQSLAAASGLSPPRVALLLKSRALQGHIRDVLSAWLQDAAHWQACGAEAVGQWLGRLRPPPPPPPPALQPRLLALAIAHLRLTLWPHVVDANAQWRFRGAWEGGAPSAPYDARHHALFSLAGRPLGEGAAVLALGPRLLGREPLCALGGEGGARAALKEELAELGGALCRCVVTEAPAESGSAPAESGSASS